MSVSDRVRDLVAPICSDLGLEIYDLEHAGGRVRVTVDKPGGVDLEAIAVATRLISRELDHADPVPGRYTLEVTSPGLERTLRTPAHFQRAVGQTVSIRLHAGTGGDRRRVTGLLAEADDEASPSSKASRAPTRGRRGCVWRTTTSNEPAPSSPGAASPSPGRAPRQRAPLPAQQQRRR